MTKPFVAVLMGSDSDLPRMQSTADILDKLGVPCEMKITSAHRTPQATERYIHDAQERGCAVFIAAAGLAAHLAGAVAAQTTRPVIGVPLPVAPLEGQDSLLSTVMMPAGVPVACVAIGSAGAKNAAYLAAQIVALADPDLDKRVRDERAAQAKAVTEKDAALQASRAS